SAWLEEVMASLGRHVYWGDVDVKSLPSGRMLLDGKPGQARRYVIAAVEQVRQFDERLAQPHRPDAAEADVIRAGGFSARHLLEVTRLHAVAVIAALMRRSLPVDAHDLKVILRWCRGATRPLSSLFGPIGSIVRAIQRHASDGPVDPELREALKAFAVQLRSSGDNEARRLGTAVEQLCAGGASDPVADPGPADEIRAAPAPAPAGSPGVLDRLKRHYGMLPDDSAPSTTEI